MLIGLILGAICSARGSLPCLLTTSSLSFRQKAEITRLVNADRDRNEDVDNLPSKLYPIGITPERLGSSSVEVIVEAGTGSQNSNFYVFSLHGDHAVEILFDGEGTGYQRLNAIHHGMHDLDFAAHVGGAELLDQVYQFDGVQYRQAYCFSEMARDDAPSDGRIQLDGWIEGPHHSCKTATVVSH